MKLYFFLTYGFNCVIKLVSAGTFRITGRLYLEDYIILRGAGSSQTRLRVEGAGTAAGCIGVAKWDSDQIHAFTALTAAVAFGGTVLQP